MTVSQVVRTLERKGKPKTVRIYARHGVQAPCFGVSYADLGTLAKQIGADTDLALALWKSGNHDARVLATKVANPDVLAERTVRSWIRDVDNYVLADAVSRVAARMPGARTLALDWVDARSQWISASGWQVLAVLALDGAVSDAAGHSLIGRIRRTIAKAPNRTRYAMNNALIALGGTSAALTEPALAAARAVGPVEVDHGQTGCKTPDAADMIGRMRARGTVARMRVTGARLAKKR